MRVLVTGGSGFVEMAAIEALTAHGHEVVGSPEGCDVILHAANSGHEDGGAALTAGVEATKRLLEDATRAGVRRFVLVSHLGAQDGDSDFHRSSRRQESLVREWQGDWTICRTGPVYGPGDRTVSLLLRAIRVLPVMPVVEEHPFQPVWISDLGEALARACEREDLGHRTLELAGPEALTIKDLAARLSKAAGKSPRLVPVPAWLADIGVQAAGAMGLADLGDGTLLFNLTDHAAIPKGRSNALVGELGVNAVPIAEGLRRLVGQVPESSPRQGAGPMWRGRFWADIKDSAMDADALFELVRGEFSSLVQQGAVAPPSSQGGIVEGSVVSIPLPLRGDALLRVQEIQPYRITCVTLEGQPFAGAMRMLVEPRGSLIRLEVQTYERAGNIAELLALAAGGAAFKSRAWQQLVERVVARSAGRAPLGVETEEEALPGDQVAEVESWLAALPRRDGLSRVA